jgi:hypothetical protein
MLIISLILSVCLLLAANWFVFRARHPVGKTIGLSLALALGPFFLMCVLPSLALQGLLLSAAVVAWRYSHRGPSFFLRLSCGATLVSYALAGWMVWDTEGEYRRLRALYPYKSMEARLPPPQSNSREVPLTAVALDRLDQLEAEVDENSAWGRIQLELLHEHAVQLFIDSPGFGVARVIRPTEQSLTLRLRPTPVPPQAGPRITSDWSPGEFKLPPAGDEAFLAWMFEDSVKDFVFSRGWGFVKDRRHVAGFLSHRFSQVPAPTDGWKVRNHTSQFSKVPPPSVRWKVRTLDLVGLLLHDEPVVYVSDHLPRMDELRAAPTRLLDKFETLGLASMRRGEDLFITRDGEGIRMLGGLHSTKQCVACHGGKRGDLLGAFSYTLQRDGD